MASINRSLAVIHPFSTLFDDSNLSRSYTKYHGIIFVIIMTFTTANEKLYIGQINLFKVYMSSFNIPLSNNPKKKAPNR